MKTKIKNLVYMLLLSLFLFIGYSFSIFNWTNPVQSLISRDGKINVGTKEIKFNDKEVFPVLSTSGNSFSDDITTTSITQPLDTNFLTGNAIAPKAKFKNIGSSNQVFVQVTMTINPGGYSSTKMISNINSGDSVQVTFDSTFNPSAGIFNIIAYSGLANDQNRNNDTINTSVIFIQNQISEAPFQIWNQLNGNYFNIKKRGQHYFNNRVINDSLDDEEEDLELTSFLRWDEFWKTRVSGFDTLNSFSAYHKEMKTFFDNYNQFCEPISLACNRSWKFVGPKSYSCLNMGIVVSLYVDPLNDNFIIAGSNSSGVWKSIDGGASWQNKTSTVNHILPSMAVNSIAVQPVSSGHSQVFFIASGLGPNGHTGAYGILKSADDGEHWERTTLSNDPGDPNIQNLFSKVAFDPNHLHHPDFLHALSKNRVYTYQVSTEAKGYIEFNSNTTQFFREIVFDPGAPWTFYVSSSDPKIYDDHGNLIGGGNAEMQKIVYNTGGTADLTPLLKTAIGNNTPGADNIAITINPISNLMYAAYQVIQDSTVGFVYLLRAAAPYGPGDWQLHGVQNFNPSNFSINTLAVTSLTSSETNPDFLYQGDSPVFWKSTTARSPSINFFSNYDYWGYCSSTHGDVRCIQVLDKAGNDEIFLGTDGGIIKSIINPINPGTDWINLNGNVTTNQGYATSQFFGHATSEIATEIYAGGTQDNGIWTYDDQKYQNEHNWKNNPSCDAYRCVIDKSNPKNIICASFCGGYGPSGNVNPFFISNDRGENWSLMTLQGISDLTQNYNRPLIITGNNRVYTGYGDVFRTDFPSASSWDKVTNFGSISPPPYNQVISALGVSDNDLNVIYVGFLAPFTWSDNNTSHPVSRKLYRVKNILVPGHPTPADYKDITSGLDGVAWQSITDICVDPRNANRLWVTFGNFWLDHKVYYSDNGGDSWTSMSEGLPALPVNCMVYEKSGKGLYIGTDVGVYYRKDDPSSTKWYCFNFDLPTTMVSHLEITSCAHRLSASTFGMGIWQTLYCSPVWTFCFMAPPQALLGPCISPCLNSSGTTLNMRDTLRAYLRDVNSPYPIVDSAIGIMDSISFLGQFQFTNAHTGNYYIVIKHRNSLETWSKVGGEHFVTDTSFCYNFTEASSQAYGNNMILVGDKWFLYSGDVNQDGFIDLFDVVLIYNDASSYLTGYAASDLNGDNMVDLTDLAVAANNAFDFVSAITPYGSNNTNLNNNNYQKIQKDDVKINIDTKNKNDFKNIPDKK